MITKCERLIYVANARIPNESAHTNQIVQMCEAFGKKIETLLVTFPSNMEENIFDYYSIDRTFKVRFLNLPKFLLSNYHSRDVVLALYSSLLVVKLGVEVIVFSRSIIDSFIIKILTNRFVVCEIHDIPNDGWVWLSIKKHMYGVIDDIVVITRGLEEDLIELGVDKDKIVVLPDGVNLKKFKR